MKIIRIIAASLVLLLVAAVTAAEKTAAPSEEGFERVFDGKSLRGWFGPTDGFEVVEGALTWKEGLGGTIYTKHRLSDFTVRFEVKVPEGGDGGLAIRYPGSGDPAYVGMCEIRLRDESTPPKDRRAGNGSAYGLAPATSGAMRARDEWNSAELRVKGSTLKLFLNEKLVLDTDLGTITEFMDNHPHPGKDRETGHFGISGEGKPLWFRNIRLKKI